MGLSDGLNNLLRYWRRTLLITTSFLVCLICAYIFRSSWMGIAFGASTQTITSRVQFETGLFSQTESVSKEGDLKLKASGTWNTRVWKTPNVALNDGTALATDGTYTYIVAARERQLYQYIPQEDRMRELSSSVPHTPYLGADMTILNNSIYMIFGGYRKSFSRYDIATNTWTSLADAPDLIAGGGSISTDGTNIYVLRGTNSTDFWKYTVATNTWSTLAITASTIGAGADLVFDNSTGTDYFFTPRGNGDTAFYRYTISTNTWTTRTVAPASLSDYGNITRNGDYIYVLRGSATQTFYRYSISGNSWTTLINTPAATRYVGLIYNSYENLLYAFQGNGTYNWWKYNTGTAAFLGPPDLLTAQGTGSNLYYYNGAVYYNRGGNNTNFYSYTISSGTWTSLTSSTIGFNDDTKGVVAGGAIYFLRGSSTTDFYSYTVTSGSWTSLSAVPAVTGGGGSLAYPGSGDYIYATRGGSTTAFWRYSISGNSWSDVAVADLPSDNEMGIGGRLVSDGTYVYATTGIGIQNLLRYDISGNSWTSLGTLPFAPYYGVDLYYYNSKIYALGGQYKKSLWEYAISGGTWRRLADITGYYANDIGPYNGASMTFDTVNNVFYIITGSSLTRMLTYTPAATNYPTTGTWTSDTIDLTYVSSWNSLTAGSTTPGNSSITFETRTSADKSTWTSWASVSGSTVSSSAQRYIQIRATLNSTSDQTQTPTLNSISISYEGDTTAPTNPSAFTGTSQSVSGTSIVSGTAYTYQYPYFSWSGASDGQTSVSGYYVYFGTNSSADPATAGNLQTASNYTVTEPMSRASYYLRVKTVDAAGNISSATTGFTYVYTGIAPPLSYSRTLSADFAGGTATNVSTSSDAIQLSSKAGFWQQKRLTTAPATISYGAGFAYVSTSGKLYTFRGGNTTTFYSYDIATDTWSTLAVAPAAVNTGGDLVEGPSDYLYGLRGNATSAFWRYRISTNTWSDTDAADAPFAVSSGGSLVYDGSRYIYALKGSSDDAFARYDTTNDVWENMANVDFGAPDYAVDNLIQSGGDLIYDGNGTIYAIQGNTRAGFASYSISGNSWTRLTNLPALAYDGANISYDSTSNAIYYLSGWSEPFMYKYDIDTETWSKLADAPATIANGGVMRNVSGILYVLRGASSTTFWRYHIAKATWELPNWGFFGPEFRSTDQRTFNYGAAIVKGNGNYVYLTRGNYDNLFSRYDPTTGEITYLADAPAGFYIGASLVYVSGSNKIYATASNVVRKLLVYDIATDTWSEESSDVPPFDSDAGSSMVYDGSRYIYWTRGGGNTTFYRFDTQGSSGSKWSSLSSLPAAISYGSDLVLSGGYIYATRGNNTTSFYRYDISGNSWSDPAVADLTTGANMYNDGFLVLLGSSIYACRGGNVAVCYVYSISGNSWSAIANAPANISQGGAAASNGTDKMYVIAGPGTNTFANGLYTYIFQTSTSSFEESGQYISASHDLTSVYKYANITLTYSTATNTTITVSTRTSSDNSTFSDWSEASELKTIGSSRTYKVNSTPARYIQVKFAITSGDGIYSPTISDYTVYYYQDVSGPTNPTTISAYNSDALTTSITSGTWYNYTSPYFDWPDAETTGGATDTSSGSGVSGYYVYFGADSVADPVVSGTFTTSSNFVGVGLTSGSTYYLRVKTKDNANQTTSSSWDAFTYKYDTVNPTNPSTIVADPSGYSATNSFNFSWSGASDSDSGIAQYCYKTGASGAADTCISTTSIAGVTAYTTGTNTLYIRSKDNAGNYAEYTTNSYYYSSVAPGAPQNLAVSPSSNTVNQFSFTWSPPATYYGSQSGLRYYYSVNAHPTANNVNTVGLSTAYLTTDAYATQKGSNILYVVAKDEAGNIDYNNYATVTFTADTSSPGAPTDIDIADVSVKETKSWKLAISWEPPSETGSGLSTYKVYRSSTSGASCSSDFSAFSYISSTTGKSFVDTDLTQQTYYYCVKACTSTNDCSASSDTVSFYPDGKWKVSAELTTDPEAEVKTRTATITWSTSRESNSFVKYGKSAGSYGSEIGSSEQVTAHEIDLTGLDPGTTYYYKVLWTDEDGNTGESDEFNFTTEAAPSVSEVKITNVSLYSAYVNFKVKNAVKASVEYGKTITYGGFETISTSKSESIYTVQLIGLADGTDYHLRITASDDEGNKYSGDDYTFKTLPVPKITALRVQQVEGMPTATLRLIWTTNTRLTSVVTYYPVGQSSETKDYISLVPSLNHEAVIKDLKDETTYIFVVKGKDAAGNEAKSDERKIETASDLRPPEVDNVEVESSIVGVGEEARATVNITWDTDEPATSQIEYGEGASGAYTSSTQEDPLLASNHSLSIPGLSPSKIYHFRIMSADKNKNKGISQDVVVITPNATKDALNLVVDKLSKTFGFLKRLR